MRIRTRMLFLLVLPLVSSLLGRPASAATDMFLQVVGAVQGPILGESIHESHANWIDVLSYSWGVEVPVGPNGQPSGDAKPSPLFLMKSWDRSSVKLLTAADTEELLTTCKLELKDASSSTVYYRVALTNAHIMSIQQSGSSETPTESVGFSYSQITLTDVLRGISVTYDWNSGGVAAVATRDLLAKGILLPPSPNPTRGQTQFRFSLPSGMASDLTLFDAQGRVVRELHHGSATAQSVVKVWDGTDDGGRKVAPGVYMARLAYAGAVVTQHFAVVR